MQNEFPLAMLARRSPRGELIARVVHDLTFLSCSLDNYLSCRGKLIALQSMCEKQANKNGQKTGTTRRTATSVSNMNKLPETTMDDDNQADNKQLNDKTKTKREIAKGNVWSRGLLQKQRCRR